MLNKGGSQYAVTVFTATYNRAPLLPRVYRSLVAQKFRDFEWLIVDDGSTDGSENVVRQFISEARIPIRYIWQENRGLHSAINCGVREAKGYFFAGLDSDDWYHPDSLDRLIRLWAEIPVEQKNRFAGVVGMSQFESGEIEGVQPTSPILDSNPVEIRVRYGVTGNRAGVMRTDVLREFPFPEDNRSFLIHQIVWNRIGKMYLIRYVNEPITIIEYQTQGLTNRALANQIRAASMTRVYYSELLDYPGPIPWRIRIKYYANYIRFSLHASVPLLPQLSDAPSLGSVLLSYPVGCYLYWRDRLRKC